MSRNHPAFVAKSGKRWKKIIFATNCFQKMEGELVHLVEDNPADSVDSEMHRPHPLYLYPVLSLVFKHASFETLLSCRQVCKLWKTEAARFVHEKSKIVINGTKNLDKLGDVISTCQDGDFPTTRFTFKNINFNNPDTTRQIFTYFGYQIKTLNLKGCLWTSRILRELIFQHLPNLQILDLEMDYEIENSLENSLLPVLPMSFGIHHEELVKLKALHLVGDFSRHADVIFDILKQGRRNLQVIHLNKIKQTQDDLFGTWLFEIIHSLKFPRLTSLEIDCCLIPIQVESLLDSSLPVTVNRLCLNLTQIGHSIVFSILKKFKRLESAEFQLDHPPTDLIGSISNKFPKSKVWVAIHSNIASKFTFPLRNPTLRID